MQMLYNSDSYVVVRFELEPQPAAGESNVPGTGGYEIVDKFARKEIYIEGALAERFQQGVQDLVAQGPNPEAMDEYIGSFATSAQQPVLLH